MELVRFYACAGDPVLVAAKLVSKACDRGESICVCGEFEALQRLSSRLWQAPGFLAHAAPTASEAVRRRSRMRLCEQPPKGVAFDVLLNLGTELNLNNLPAKRLFEVFGSSSHERQAARARYRRVQADGWPTETVQVASV